MKEIHIKSLDFNNINNNYELKHEYTEKISPNGYTTYLYFGRHKLEEDNCIIIKNIEIDFNKIQNYEINQIKKSIFLLNTLNNKNYFPKLVNLSLSEDKKNIYVIFKGNNISLDRLIRTKVFDYKNQKNLIKYIIYQITYGLYVLHSNNIIHHNLKPLFILIDEKANISIYNFLSSIFKGEQSIYFTSSYAAPELFISGINIDEKYDMWSLGVIMIELYLRKLNYFSVKDNEKGKDGILNIILSKFDINGKNNYENLNILMKNILSGQTKAEFKIEEILNEINDLEAIELINNLLTINPKERFSAEQALKSKYLNEYIDINPLKVEQFNFSQNNCKNLNDKTKLIDAIDKMFYLKKNN